MRGLIAVAPAGWLVVTPLSRAAIVAVGSELLTPSRIDTNSLFITEQLNLARASTSCSSRVAGDDRDELAHALPRRCSRAPISWCCCGGLGPTDDDVTREVVAEVLGRPLPKTTRRSRRSCARGSCARGFAMPMPEINRRQAMVPAGARRDREHATAARPDCGSSDGDRVVLLLPGPPRELKPMLAALVDGPLRERASGAALVRRVVRIAGRIESHVGRGAAAALSRVGGAPSPPIAATILAALGQIELHLSARAPSPRAPTAALDAAVAQVVEVLGEDVFSTDGRTLERGGRRSARRREDCGSRSPSRAPAASSRRG